ncbi:MAG: hypothetical protein LBG07_04545 [Treponema sp.]|nr:hypothetical protein [Treponema sp.]
MPQSAYPNCLLCRYFKVTWDSAFPRSCGLFGFKCLDLPSVEVFKSTGKHCPAFRERESRK